MPFPNVDPNRPVGPWIVDEDGYLKSIPAADQDNPEALANAVKSLYLKENDYATVNYLEGTDAIFQYYKQNNQLNVLKNKLEQAFGTKISYVGDADFRKLLQEAMKQTTATNWFAQSQAPGNERGKQITILDWLNKQIATGGAGGSDAITSEVNYTQKKTAWDMFKSVSQDLLNITPSRDNFEDFYKKLHAKEGKYITSWKDVGGRRYTDNAKFDPQEFTIDYLVKQIDANTKLKGQAGQAKRALDQLVENNGLSAFISSKTKVKFLKDILTQDKSVEDFQEVIRKQAKNVYSQWAQEMDDNPDMSFADLISPYVQRYQSTLEIDGPVDIADVAKTATAGGEKLSAFDYEKALRNDTRWGYTKQANAEAADLAKSFAKAFGVNV